MLVQVCSLGRRRGARRPRTGFYDSFDRPDEVLTSSPNWTLLSGTPGAAEVRSGALATLDPDMPGSAFASPDLGAANHFVEFRIANAAETADTGSFVCCRLVDASNFVGLRYLGVSQTVECFKRVNDTFSLLGSYNAALPNGTLLRLEVSTDTTIFYVDGVERGLSILNGDLASVTRQGVVARSAVTDPLILDYRAGLL